MNHRFYRLLYFLLLLYVYAPVMAQEEDAKQNVGWQNKEALIEFSANWVPTLLSASSLPIYNLSQFHGFVFSWVPRGQSSNRGTYIDGINWQSKIGAWDFFNSYAGMYKAFHSMDMVSNLEYSKLGFGDPGSVNYLTANTRFLKKAVTIATRFSNSSLVYEGQLQLNSGPIKNRRWSYQFNAVFQQAPMGLIPNGFKKLTGIAFSVDKQLKQAQSIGMTIWWDHVTQGKISPSVQEAFDLSTQRNYNPSWGWYKGKPFYPNQKSGDVPVTYFRYEKKWREKAILQMQIGVAVGVQKKSQMDWANTLDPRPDYYKYLPSYSKDSLLRKQLVDWFTSNPQALQIDFDHLEKINQSNATHQSFYIVNTKVARVQLLRLSMRLQYQFPLEWSGQIGLHAAKDVIRNSNVIENLLGGNYFLNYNGWVDDNGSATNFQNEIRLPDQKIKVGQTWGGDYALQNAQLQLWGQLYKQMAKYEFGVSLKFEENRFNRTGYNQNGLFPMEALGQSSLLSFPSYGLKAQYLYKFSGRFYAKTILFQQTNAPNSSEIYLDPAVHPYTASFILPAWHRGIDLALYYRGVYTKMNASIFWQSIENASEKNLFYHDHFFAFMYGMLGQMQTIHEGAELGMETQFGGPLQLSAVSSFGRYFIANNPLYEIRLVYDLYKVESGVLQLQGLPATSNPQSVQAISIQYQPDYSSRISITGVYSMKRSIDYNYFRRSILLRNQINNEANWNLIQSEKYLPNQWVFNAFMSKQYVFNVKSKKQQIRFSASIRNVLNTRIPLFSFEQSRFDYAAFRLEKFPLKYMYDQGTTYALGAQLQIQ